MVCRLFYFSGTHSTSQCCFSFTHWHTHTHTADDGAAMQGTRLTHQEQLEVFWPGTLQNTDIQIISLHIKCTITYYIHNVINIKTSCVILCCAQKKVYRNSESTPKLQDQQPNVSGNISWNPSSSRSCWLLQSLLDIKVPPKKLSIYILFESNRNQYVQNDSSFSRPQWTHTKHTGDTAALPETLYFFSHLTCTTCLDYQL